MDILKKKKTPKVIVIVLLIITVYAGFCFGMFYGQEITLENGVQVFFEAAFHPWRLRITPITKTAVLVSLILWLLVYAYVIGKQRNYMPGREYGSGRLATPREVNKMLMDPDESKNKIISEHIRISTDTRLTGLNNNVLIVGGSGAGKTFYIVMPNGYHCGNSSYVFCDPKGELLRDIGNYLEARGYTVRVLNLVEMDASDCYNPFAYIRSDEDITRLITNLITNTTPHGSKSSDPFWEKGEAMLLQSIFLYVWYEYPKQGRIPNFRGVLELLNEADVDDNGREESKLGELMYRLPENHPALITYKKVCVGASDTIRSLVISANARLAYLENSRILHILDHDDMDLASLGEGIYCNPDRKTALFCVIPDNDTSYSFIVGMLYTQLFQELYYVADHKYGGRLPVPVALWMDEFANCALPEDFTKILATCRGREISCNIIIQNLAQLKTLYKDAWENITGDCDTLIYLGGNEQSTHKYMSEMLGKITIDKRSSGETTGNHGSSSKNYDVLGRDMLDPSEVRKLDNGKCLVFIKGFDPVCDDKYRTPEKEEFLAAQALGPYEREAEEKELKDGRDIFYLNCRGNREASIFYMVENHMGIFEESEAFAELKDTEEYLVSEVGQGYTYSNTTVYPAFSKDGMPTMTGMGRITKHRVIGYSCRDRVIPADEDFLKEIFCKRNRVSEQGF